MSMYDRDNPQHQEFASQARMALPGNPPTAEQFATIKRYWRDPAYRQQCAEEQVKRQAEIHARMDAAIAKARGVL